MASILAKTLKHDKKTVYCPRNYGMRILRTCAGDLDFSQRPFLMGILNVTPDSFSDGARYVAPEDAISRAEAMAEEGARLIDIGGESTRPGADPVTLDEELRRVVPVVEILAARLPGVAFSVDTTKAEVARRCLDAGASLVNDVSALRSDPDMAGVIKDHGVPVILMHRKGNPQTMQDNPAYDDVVNDVLSFLTDRIDFALSRGLRKEQLLADPGFGFGKTVEHNVELLRRFDSFSSLNVPLVVGASRKSFIGKILGGAERPLPPEDRLEGTLAVHLWAAARGAHILRVHDVGATARALALWKTLERH